MHSFLHAGNHPYDDPSDHEEWKKRKDKSYEFDHKRILKGKKEPSLRKVPTPLLFISCDKRVFTQEKCVYHHYAFKCEAF